MPVIERPLGQRRPTDQRHIRGFPLREGAFPTIPTPVCVGSNWYSSFDRPEQSGRVYRVARGGDWGGVRGGHEYCLKPPDVVDLKRWWQLYDQGTEGACVGFALSRMMSLLNRLRYDGEWLYREAQRVDEWEGEDYDGTSGRAGCDVLRKVGHKRIHSTDEFDPYIGEGILENRWALSVEDIARCLSPADGGKKVLDAGYVTILNSWGESGYPHYTRMALESLDRLVFHEDGDATMVTDRPSGR